MIKRGIVKTIIDLLRYSVRSIFLVTMIFLALFICWFCFHFLLQLMDFCMFHYFSEKWY